MWCYEIFKVLGLNQPYKWKEYEMLHLRDIRLIPKKRKKRKRHIQNAIWKGVHNMGCLDPTLTGIWYSMCVQLSFKNEFSKWLNVETCEVTFWIRRVTMSDMYRVQTRPIWLHWIMPFFSNYYRCRCVCVHIVSEVSCLCLSLCFIG